MKSVSNYLNYARGFSLVELMIVVVIIGILSAVGIPSYTEYVQKSRIAQMVSIAEECKKSIALRYSETLMMPNSIRCNGVASITNGANGETNSIRALYTRTSDTVGKVTLSAAKINNYADRLVYTITVTNDTIVSTCGVRGSSIETYLPEGCAVDNSIT